MLFAFGGRREAETGDRGRPSSSGSTASATSPPPAIAPFDATQARRYQEAWAEHLGIPVETTNSIGQTLVVIPPGRFTMGEGANTVDVTLTAPFLLGQTEVTQGQWKEVMETEPWQGKAFTIEGADVVATFVSQGDAVDFCLQLTERERADGRIGREQEYRLPTEAEWEFACRAGTITVFSFGDDEALLGDHAWFGGGWQVETGPTPGGNTREEMHAHAVALKRPNPFGLFDIHGNVWEAVSRWSREDHASDRTDPEGRLDGSRSLSRGGCWLDTASNCRSAHRRMNDQPSARTFYLGFRVTLGRVRAGSQHAIAPDGPAAREVTAASASAITPHH